ncbi:hypothetical protein [Roseovarius aestuariivivens]|uniref:hypothetical protein n=1 Tax=Roseovarius aestuariivivens TaxID=1888910 RepID=UPI0010800F21|nr:hypothetical protein [Roseovarius aestuariivivens]
MTKKQNILQQQEKPITEEQVVDAVRTKKHARPRAPRLEMNFDEDKRVNSLKFDHEDQSVAYTLAMYDVGTGDADFFQGILKQVASLGSQGKPVCEDATNFVLSVIRSVDPQDEVEAMLAAQMAATHLATMTFARRLNHVETIPQQDSAERALNKLARTFTTQMETLKKHRAKAQQTVRVERVLVSEGGQAIVGDVSTGGEGSA